MLIEDFCNQYLNDDFNAYSLNADDKSQEISQGEDVTIDACDLDRDGLSQMTRDKLELIDSYEYWLDDSEDAYTSLDEIISGEDFVIHSEMTIPPFCDDGSDATANITIYWCQSETDVQEKIEQCKNAVLDNMTGYLSSPLVTHKHYLGSGAEMGAELSKVIDAVLKHESLENSIAAFSQLNLSLKALKKMYAKKCFSSLFPNQSPVSIQYSEDNDEIYLSDIDEAHTTDDLISSVDEYLEAAHLLGSKKTEVTSQTLQLAQRILRE